jgi:hypothetical protein
VAASAAITESVGEVSRGLRFVAPDFGDFFVLGRFVPVARVGFVPVARVGLPVVRVGLPVARAGFDFAPVFFAGAFVAGFFVPFVAGFFAVFVRVAGAGREVFFASAIDRLIRIRGIHTSSPSRRTRRAVLSTISRAAQSPCAE